MSNFDQALVQNLRERIAMASRVLAYQELVDDPSAMSARAFRAQNYVLIRVARRGAGQSTAHDLRTSHARRSSKDSRVEGKYPPPDETKLHTEI